MSVDNDRGSSAKAGINWDVIKAMSLVELYDLKDTIDDLYNHRRKEYIDQQIQTKEIELYNRLKQMKLEGRAKTLKSAYKKILEGDGCDDLYYRFDIDVYFQDKFPCDADECYMEMEYPYDEPDELRARYESALYRILFTNENVCKECVECEIHNNLEFDNLDFNEIKKRFET